MTTTLAMTTQITQMHPAHVAVIRFKESRSHRCRGAHCSTCDSDADLGLGLTDLELDDDVYCSDSEFDEAPRQSPLSRWRHQSRRTATGKVTVSRRDSGVGSITHDDVCEQELYGAIDEERTERVLPPTGQCQSILTCNVKDSSRRRRLVPRMGTKMLQRHSPDVSTTSSASTTSDPESSAQSTRSFPVATGTTPLPTDSAITSPNDRTSTDVTTVGDHGNVQQFSQRTPEATAVAGEARWVVRRRSDGSRYITRRTSVDGDVMQHHTRSRRRSHRLPSNDDMIVQWRRLASRLANGEVPAADEQRASRGPHDVFRKIAVEVI